MDGNIYAGNCNLAGSADRIGVRCWCKELLAGIYLYFFDIG